MTATSDQGALSYQPPGSPVVVPYSDLGGGLNTRLDQHALQRNELAVSINLWSAFDNAISKRPGSIPLVTVTGAVGSGVATISLLSCRFVNQTYLIQVDANRNVWGALAEASGSWTLLGAVGPTAKFCTAAQMFNPNNQRPELYLCDGVTTPQQWAGPGHVLVTVPTGAGNLPTKYNSATPITPQFVRTLGNNSHLFYSGEPTNTSAVYISDPFYPTTFTSPAMQVTTDPSVGAYVPAIIGNNDGVEGGNIAGMETLGSAMIVFKESATYSMIQTTLLGEVPAWQVVQVSPSIGCHSPRSIVRFDAFITFLAIDGVYITDGNTTQQISGDVPTYFDGSLTGFPALITSRQLAMAVRHGNRMEIFFPTANLNYCNMGVWFDFTKQSRFGNPLAGEIDNMNVGGIVALRSQADTGNVAWGDALIDRVGEFGVGYNDFGNPIATMFAGKADLFDDVLGPDAAISTKQAQDAYVMVELLNVASQVSVDFYGQIIVDLALTLPRVIGQVIDTNAPGGLWGFGLWGSMLWGASSNDLFGIVKVPLQNAARGHLLQLAVKENSIVPWVIIGYAIYVNKQRVGY